MKVKELIKELEKYDGDLEVLTRRRYTEDMKPVTGLKVKYLSLNKKVIYLG